MLGILAIITILGMIYSFKLNFSRYVPLAILGVFFYFLFISSGPNGYGTYPRFRLSLSFIQAVYFGIFYDRMISRKSKSVKKNWHDESDYPSLLRSSCIRADRFSMS